MTQPKFITIKEVAAAVGLSVRTVRRHEKSFGLDKCRDGLCEKPTRYFANQAKRELRVRGHDIAFQ